MKKLLAVLISLAMMLSCAAFAEDMIVINCEEWVSLRTGADTSAERIAKVPLGAVVNDCTASDGWVYGCYEGNYGYIADKYLESYSGNTDEEIIGNFGDITVRAYYSCYDGSESFYIEATDAEGKPVWWHNTHCSFTTELTMVEVFLAGTSESPLVMAFSAETGLEALDFFTGEVLWKIENDTLSLGGSICYAVDADGTMYVGGYYGPDPVAISAEGEIKWQTDFQGSYIWLYRIEIEGENLRCYYDMDDVDYVPVNVIIAKNGNFVGLEY